MLNALTLKFLVLGHGFFSTGSLASTLSGVMSSIGPKTVLLSLIFSAICSNLQINSPFGSSKSLSAIVGL